MANEEFYWYDDNDTNTKIQTAGENGRLLSHGINYCYGKQRNKRSDILASYSRYVSNAYQKAQFA